MVKRPTVPIHFRARSSNHDDGEDGTLELRTSTDALIVLALELPATPSGRTVVLANPLFKGPCICFCGAVVMGNTVCSSCAEQMATDFHASLAKRSPSEAVGQ